MKKIKLLAFIMLSQCAFSQIWVNSLEDAKKLAKSTNKFIMIDFNASWCKPCRQMESEFFSNEKFKPTLDKFIAVSIDIDSNRDLASFYSVQSIPNLKIIDINGEVIHDVLGYDGAESSNKEFEGFPDNTEDLYENLVFKDKKNPSDEELLNLATSYQVLLQKSSNRAQKNFLSLSNIYYNKCIKKTKDANIKEISELGRFFNSALTDSGNKVIKNLDISKITPDNKSYAHYILAKAHYMEKNKAEAEKNIGEIERINDQRWTPAAKALKAKYMQ
ncbi:MAG: thioredoxin family protein [Chryseobacterium sp.]